MLDNLLGSAGFGKIEFTAILFSLTTWDTGALA
jgi:hypothetical protein